MDSAYQSAISTRASSREASINGPGGITLSGPAVSVFNRTFIIFLRLASCPHMIYFLVYLEIYMGRPLMIQEEDERRIEILKQKLGVPHKVDVLRAGIDLLEKEAERRERIRPWKRAAALVTKTSRG